MPQGHIDEMLAVAGFRIEITDPAGEVTTDTWETCVGGGLNIEATGAPGQPVPEFIDEIVLRGPMLISRTWTSQLVNQARAGSPARFNLAIIEILKDGSESRRFNYQDCFITRYEFPLLSAGNYDMLEETITIKPEKLTVA